MTNLPPHKICPQCGQPAVLDMPVCRRCGFPFPTPNVVPVFVPVPMTALVPPRKRSSSLKLAWRLLKLCALLFLALLAYRWFYVRRHSFLGEWEDRKQHIHLTLRRDKSLSESFPDPTTGDNATVSGIWMAKDQFLTIEIGENDPETYQWVIDGDGYVMTLTPEDQSGNERPLVLHRLSTDWHF
ncbi:MAG TPA: hypothetical protein VFA07_12790 [Chthonomonadaceae bacterium]|nr:hypothetical protein [Chthonomonadaceae bacterium]